MHVPLLTFILQSYIFENTFTAKKKAIFVKFLLFFVVLNYSQNVNILRQK